MDLGEVANVAIIIQAVLLVGSLAIVGIQLRVGNRLARASGLHQLTAQGSGFSGQIAADADLARLWYSHGQGLEDVDRDRYRELLIQWLLIQENVYYQSQDDLLPDAVVEGWTIALHKAVQKHNFRIISPRFEQWFPGPFGDHIAALLTIKAPEVGDDSRPTTDAPDGNAPA